ncbi:MAG: DUF4147 domain-containing protein [Thermomicrobiales bacterium]|nr:DUF4147 domain-containing protein [Thermomicrobiales bacterium]
MSGDPCGFGSIERWFQAALAAVDPARAVTAALRRTGSRLQVGEAEASVAGRLYLVALGKAAAPMARAAAEVAGDLLTEGVVITKDGHLDGTLPAPLDAFEAAHPIPDERGVAATRRALDLIGRASSGDVVLALISGGGSALFEAPCPPVSLLDMARTTDLLLRAGAPIQDLNAVRTPLSLVKGGGFRTAAPAAKFVTLVLSDVLGNDLRTIASGPTIPGRPDAAAGLAVLARYRVLDEAPRSVVATLRNLAAAVDAAETATAAGDVTAIVADNAAAIAGAEAAIRRDGLRPAVIWRDREGEAAHLGRAWVAACREAPAEVDVLLGGGEATVTVTGKGVGGRNTEFALAAALELERLGETGWAVASLATDGQDGPTGVAGAIADSSTVDRARAAGVDALAALRDNDSLAVFQAGGGIVAPGPTGTNVNDLYFGLRVAAPSACGQRANDPGGE